MFQFNPFTGTLDFISDPRGFANSSDLACLQFTHASQSAANINPLGANYFFGLPIDLIPLTSAGRHFSFPYPARIEAATLQILVGTLPSGEASGAGFDLFSVTDQEIVGTLFSGNNGLLYSATSTVLQANYDSNPIQVRPDKLYCIRAVSPLFATSPGAVRRFVHLYFSKLQNTATLP
jgi:hypothetical protein